MSENLKNPNTPSSNDSQSPLKHEEHIEPLTLDALPTEEQLAGMTTSHLERLLAKADAQIKLLDLREKLKNSTERVSNERAKAAEFRDKMRVLESMLINKKQREDRCNHHKGGQGAEAVINGQGSSAIYCVIKHFLPNGTAMVICQRCCKEWFAADPFANGGKGTPETPGYQQAVNFVTDNSPSGSSRFIFTRDRDYATS
jgi:hypothetical protein